MSNSEANKEGLSVWEWITLALIALIAGGVGSYFVYSFQSQIPGIATINEIPSDLMNRTRPIIRDAKKVVVEQNDNIQNVATDLSNNLLVIVRKPDVAAQGWQKNYYNAGASLAEALPMTSDGWVVTNYAGVLDAQGKPNKKLVFLDHNHGVYELDKVIKDRFTGLYFCQTTARSLSIRKLSTVQPRQNGSTLIAATWQGRTAIYSQLDTQLTASSTPVKSVDDFSSWLLTDRRVSGAFALANMASEVAGLVNDKGQVIDAGFVNIIFSKYLNSKSIKLPVFGFNYLDMSDLAPVQPRKGSDALKGVLLVSDDQAAWPKNSPAIAAGLKSGDIVTAVNEVEIEGNLSEQLIKVLPGTSINLTILRNDKESIVAIKAGEQK